MCIGLPLQLQCIEGTSGLARGRGRREWVDLRLVGPCEPGQWLLVFQGAARECLTPERAAEIDAALDLLEQALLPHPDGSLPAADPGFPLPSAMRADELARLTGADLPPATPAGSAGPTDPSRLTAEINS